MKNYKKRQILLCFFFITSCVKNIDFNQVDNFKPSPVLRVSLVHFSINQTNLLKELNQGKTQPMFLSHFTLFNNTFIRNNLTKIVLDFKVNNQFNKKFSADFVFYNAQGKETYRVPRIYIPQNKNDFSFSKKIIIAKNITFLKSSEIKITLILPSGGSTISPKDAKSINVKCGGTFYINN